MKKDITAALIAVVAVLAVAFGLSRMRPDLPLTPSAPYVAGKSGAPSVAKKGKVVMRVNGEPVTEEEFLAFMTAVPEQQRGVFSGPAGRRELAKELVRMKALEQEARRLGIADDPQVTGQMELLKTQVTAQRVLQKLVEQSAEKEIAAAYEREKKNVPNVLRHIAIAYQGGAMPPRVQGQRPATAEEATQKAAALVARLRAGADFVQMARAESDHVDTAQSGGSIGPVNPAGLPPEIGSVVSKLKPGQYSDPVRTDLGIHIFNVSEPTLADLRPMLMQQVQNEIAEREVLRLQKAASVDLDPQFFPAVPDPVPGRPGQLPVPGPNRPGRG